jgi:BT1 family
MDAPAPARGNYWRQQIENALLAPIRAMRLAYLPLLMVYFAYGATGLTAVAQTFWVKRDLAFTPTDLATLSVWLALPWTVKMVFGELVDTVPLMGSQRRSYVFVGAALIAISFVLLAGAAGNWFPWVRADTLFVVASLLTVIGVVLQDVVADAMSTEVVPRVNPDGSPRAKADIDHDLGMVQVLGRLALGFGIFSVAGLSGWLAQIVSYQAVFLWGLVVPLVSISGALLVSLEAHEQRPTDWRILGGGIAYGAVVVALGLSSLPGNQEIVFGISMAVVLWMLRQVAGEIEESTRIRMVYAAIIIFTFRCTPSVGEGYRWFTIDVLGFDESFYGILQQLGATIAIVAAWMFSDVITRKPVAQVLLWITILGFVLSLPAVGLVFRLDQVAERLFGFGARSIAIFDAAATSPFDQLSMIPLLTLVAIYAPSGHRATWFALMASLMNLALVAGGLLSKYLNQIFPVDRGDYVNLLPLVVASTLISLVLPLCAILLFGRRVR